VKVESMNVKKGNTLWFNLAECLNNFRRSLEHRQSWNLGLNSAVSSHYDPVPVQQRVEEVNINSISVVLHSFTGDSNDSISSFLPCAIDGHLVGISDKE